MKKPIIVLIVAMLLVVTLSAQVPGFGQGGMMGRRGMMGRPGFAYSQSPVTLDGKLVFINSYPSLKSGDKVYQLMIPRFYYLAYTNTFKEGDSIKIEGQLIDSQFIHVTKLIVGGKEILLQFGRW